MSSILHQEIGGGYATGPKVIVDTCELEPGLFETMAMDKSGEELECRRTTSLKKAESDFKEVLMKYAEPIQKAVLGANMEQGKRYTIFRFSEFGFPMAYKFTYKGNIECCTYAQYRDAVKFNICPAGKRGDRSYLLYNCSFAIVDGWQDLPDDVTWNIVAGKGDCVMKCSKYGCFDARYFEDIKKILENVVAVHENYQVGVNGVVYG